MLFESIRSSVYLLYVLLNPQTRNLGTYTTRYFVQSVLYHCTVRSRFSANESSSSSYLITHTGHRPHPETMLRAFYASLKRRPASNPGHARVAQSCAELTVYGTVHSTAQYIQYCTQYSTMYISKAYRGCGTMGLRFLSIPEGPVSGLNKT